MGLGTSEVERVAVEFSYGLALSRSDFDNKSCENNTFENRHGKCLA